MTKEFIDFAKQHLNEDTARLLLSAARYPSVDMPAAVQQIEGLRTAREKWPSLPDDYVYPPRLNREQASSEATARYKATLLAAAGRVADLTGGMGIDTLALSAVADHVDYVERDSMLCTLMEHNLALLGIDNVTVHCADSLQWIAQTTVPLTTLYLDPARRSSAGRKVAAFEDCSPNLLEQLPLLRARCRQLLVKASPMIDISLALSQLGQVAEVHVVALRGECKEVLFVCEKTQDEPVIHCVDLKGSKNLQDFSFRRSEEATAPFRCCDAVGCYLYEPHAALMKGGPFRLIGQRFGLQQLAPDTHLYTSSSLVSDFPGRTFEVLQELPLNRKAVLTAVAGGKAHVVVRNFPAEAAALQKQLGLTEGGDLFVVATTVGSRRAGFLCKIV